MLERARQCVMLRAAAALLLCTTAGAAGATGATGAPGASALDELMRDPQKALELVPPELLAEHGGGEPAIVGVGAVIANAIHDAVGVRLFRFPMTARRVKEALDRA